MSGTRSHARLRASGHGDLLAGRGAGGVNPHEAAKLRRDLVRLDESEASIAEQVAEVLSLMPAVTDEHVAIWCRGLSSRSDAEALVAQIRWEPRSGPSGRPRPAR